MAIPISYANPSAPAPQENQTVLQLSMPIYQARGWLKFLGVLSIISGIGGALSIVGIIFAWLPIWMGVLMLQAGSSIEAAGQLGDKFAFLRSMGSLKTYFVLQGVLALLGIIFALTMLCITFVLPLLGLTLIPWNQIINNTIY
jgi:Family of unknown function (DUF5362)